MKAPCDFWAETTRSRLVAADDPAAVTILFPAGSEIPDSEVERFGIGDDLVKALCGPPMHRARMFPAANKRASLRNSRRIG